MLAYWLAERLIHRRRLREARAWQSAQRQQAAEHNEAIRRILAAPDVRDPWRRR
jgi:hypothetical protein